MGGNNETSCTFSEAANCGILDEVDVMEEYDFSGGVRGKYARRFQEGSNVVVIDADVAEYFPDHDSVNDALRSLVEVITRQVKTPHRHGKQGS